jgi:hypothetical protein
MLQGEGEFADSKQASAVCGFGLFPLTTGTKEQLLLAFQGRAFA